MAHIQISQLNFTHNDGREVFRNVSLQLDTNWKLGLIGRNGRGKTTFLKLLHGEFAYNGLINTPVRMDYFPFTVPHADRTCADIVSKFCPLAEAWQWDKELAQLDMPDDILRRPYATLSGGESVKLLLAALFLRRNNFLLIDEPTDHLDLAGRDVVGKYLSAKRGFILVSHDRHLLDNCIDHVLSINKASIELQQGNFRSWQANRERQDQYERDEHAKLKKEVGRLEASARQSTAWSCTAEKEKYRPDKTVGMVDKGWLGHKAAKVMQRAKRVESRRNKAVEEKAKLLHDIENTAPLSMRPLVFSGKHVAELRDISIQYDAKTVLQQFSCLIRNGERIALCGKNGSGKSSILKLLAGLAMPAQGTVHIPPRLRVAYVPQDCSFVSGTLHQFACEQGIAEPLFRAVLHRFGLERAQFDTRMEDFSTGQQKKALLASCLCQEAHLYIWDEPLNYVDVISRMQLENLILQSPVPVTMIFVEHDRAFLERVATTIFDLDQHIV